MRNLPPVLKIVWDSGPVVVVLGFVFRLLAALQPVALLYVSKLIIDAIVGILSKHQPIPHRLWWLVVAEFVYCRPGQHPHPRHRLSGLAAGRQIHALRQHPGDEACGRTRRHRLRRPGFLRSPGARPGAGHRPAGHDPDAGPPGAAGHHHHHAVDFHRLLLALAIAAADRGRLAGLHRREPLCLPRLRQEFPADAGTPPARLPAHPGRQQGSRQGAEAIRPEQVPHRAFHPAVRRGVRGKCRALETQADCRSLSVDHRLAGLLLGLRLRDLADGAGRAQHRLAVLSGGSDSAGQHQHPADLLHAIRSGRSGIVPDRPAGVFRDAADHPLQAERVAGAAPHPARDSSFATCRSPIPAASGAS